MIEADVDGVFEIPIRECMPWCTSDPHAKSEHPEDRNCYSEFHRQPVSRRPPVDYGHPGARTWGYDWLDVCLRRRGEDPEPILLVNDETSSTELELTREEAKQMADGIYALLAL